MNLYQCVWASLRIRNLCNSWGYLHNYIVQGASRDNVNFPATSFLFGPEFITWLLGPT